MREKHDNLMHSAHNFTMNPHDLGRRIKELRQAKRLSQARLAERIGIDQSQISRIENGESGATLETLLALSRVFNVSLDELTGETPENDGLDALPREERDLLLAYRRLEGDNRAALRRVARALAEQADSEGVSREKSA
jgi:transcriptional regulator with XRE-family HTH domain